ncbi:peptidase associated/transthyretin-like domain-containing protein [Flavobacterium daejeonense]|uniref:hypothetical protein n=1 Tax=Flavobacterium daejeonense TaxID=350893 RepID=UPI00047C8446|nr:hypothetical protein [Flavobacterium daejeonense]
MSINFFLKISFILFLFLQNIFSQERLHKNNNHIIWGYVYSSDKRLPIENVNLKIYSNNISKYFITDENGKFEIPNNTIDSIEVSSLGYKKRIDKKILDTIYLDNDQNQLSEVIIKPDTKIKNHLSFFEKLNSFETNFSWNNKAAIFIPKSNKSNEYIKNLIFAVSDYGGVKNLKYLPFKTNLYTVDSIGLPSKPILNEDILVTKTDNENWTKVDVSKSKIIIPDEGIFVVFIILEEKNYKQNFINSKYGKISAVPALKAYKYDDQYIRKSYLFRECNYLDKCNIWLLQKLHYMIDVEYN